MHVKKVYIRPLSLTIKVLQAETKKELSTELSKLESDISSKSYQSWVLETFIAGINQVFESIVDHFTIEKAEIIKNTIFREVIKLNPLLDPKELYIDVSNQISITKTPNKLVGSAHWKVNEDSSNIAIISDFHKYFELSKQARGQDHEVETEYSDVLEMGIKVRIFNKKLKNTLMFGFCPKSEQDVKYHVIITCIDSLHDILSLVKNDPVKKEIPMSKVLQDLYDWSIHHNPFLKLRMRDVKKINNSVKDCRVAVGKDSNKSNYKGRTNISQIPKKDILQLETDLNSQLFGQEEAVKMVSSAYQRAYSGVKNPRSPIGCFLFYGGTSTGKTELARVLAKTITNDPKGLLKITCNTLQASHSVATLIGAPPGYVGYEEGCLADSMSKNNFKVILFDEVDKAHPNIYDLVLEMIEEGKLMISNGEILDFTQCMIIFTSNMGQQEAQTSVSTAGFATPLRDRTRLKEQEFLRIVEKEIKPEFLARLDGKFYFKDLTEETLLKAGTLYLKNRTDNLSENNITFTYPDKLPEVLMERCKKDNPKGFHARTFNNYIESKVIQRLGNYIIGSELIGTKSVSISLSITKTGYTFRQKQVKTTKRKSK